MNKKIKLLVLGFAGLGGAIGIGKLNPYFESFSNFYEANNMRNDLAKRAISALHLEQSMESFVAEPYNDYYDVEKHFNELTNEQQKDVLNLMRGLHGEAKGESIEGIVGVAYSVLNRKNSRNFGIWEHNKGDKVPTFIRYRTISEILHQKTGSVCQYSYYCDGISDDVPFNEKYKAIKKISIYTVLGKLDSLSNVPMVNITTEKKNNKVVQKIDTYIIPINRFETMKARKSMLYLSNERLAEIKYKPDEFFYNLVYGRKKSQCMTAEIGNHTFITAKENSQLASLL